MKRYLAHLFRVSAAFLVLLCVPAPGADVFTVTNTLATGNNAVVKIRLSGSGTVTLRGASTSIA